MSGSADQVTGAVWADGSLLDTQVWAAPLDEDRLDGATFLVHDVTERRGRRQRLAVLDRVLRHNIRNEVNVAAGHLDRLATRVPDDDPGLRIVRDRLDAIADLGETARRIERIADADRAETVTFDLVDVSTDGIERLRHAAPEATVSAVLPDRAPAVGHELLPNDFDDVLENAVEHNDGSRPRVAVDARRSSDGCSGPQRRHSSPTAPGLDCGSPTGSSVRRATGSTWRPTTGRPS